MGEWRIPELTLLQEENQNKQIAEAVVSGPGSIGSHQRENGIL
jgi:hypothetical protein